METFEGKITKLELDGVDINLDKFDKGFLLNCLNQSAIQNMNQLTVKYQCIPKWDYSRG